MHIQISIQLPSVGLAPITTNICVKFDACANVIKLFDFFAACFKSTWARFMRGVADDEMHFSTNLLRNLVFSVEHSNMLGWSRFLSWLRRLTFIMNGFALLTVLCWTDKQLLCMLDAARIVCFSK